MSASGGHKAILAAFLANTGIAVTKFIAWLVSGSASMLAEAVHSVADAGNQLLLFRGGAKARKEADREHPFGYGRERYVYAFVVSIILFSLGGLFSIYEGVDKLRHPHEITNAWVPLTVLAIAIVLELFSLRTAVRESNKIRGKQTWVQFVRTAKAPELPVVLLEDLGALVGLVLALFGVGLTLITGDGRWDAAGTACIGVLLVLIAIVLALETKSLLLGESATKADVAAIEAALVGPGVPSVIHIKTLHLGPEELLVAAKIEVDVRDSAEEIADAIDAAEGRVRAAVPIAARIYLEPDLRD